jgi:hypothetical protein
MTKQLISIHKICETYQIPDSFFDELIAYDLLPVHQKETDLMIDENQLPHIEKLMRLYFDLNINMEGIDVIINLLNQIAKMQDEINVLKQRLKVYENF